jgi:hypothetical protein
VHHDLPNFSYRSLEAVCRAQAAMTSCPDTRRELERIAWRSNRRPRPIGSMGNVAKAGELQ